MRLTPEREKEIRARQICTYPMVQYLLAEIDSLRKESELMPESAFVCCCGDSIVNHASPIDCGHSPVSMLDHSMASLEKERDQLKAAVERYEVILIDLVREGHQPVKTFAENALAEVDRILSGTGDAVDTSGSEER